MAEVVEVFVDKIELLKVHELEANDKVTGHQVLVKPLEGLVDCKGHLVHDKLGHLSLFARFNCILHEGESDEHNEEAEFNPVPSR